MRTSSEHSRIITCAAKEALLPLGFRQRGRSRLWFADHGFWATVVEFTPSGFSKGTYLTIGVMWLWYPTNHWRFDYCCQRLGGFVSAEKNKDFEAETKRLAVRAATEALSLANKLTSIERISKELLSESNPHPVAIYSTAVAAGLCGNTKISSNLFDRLESEYGHDERYKDLLFHSQRLVAGLITQAQFQSGVSDIVGQTREMLGSPALHVDTKIGNPVG